MPPPHAKPGMCQPVNLDPARLIFINETDDEYAPSIRRRSVWPALGLIGPARSLEDVPSPRAAPLDGAVNGTTSRSYVEQMHVPTLSTGDIVLLDNLPHSPSRWRARRN
jgi:hypothetical protein